MADNTVTLTRLTLNTISSDLIAALTDNDTGETFGIDVSGDTTLPSMAGDDRLLLVLEEQDGSTASVEFDAGDYPPSALKDKGSLSVDLAANDLVLLELEAGRFLQNDGTITGTVTGGVRIGAFRIPYPSSEA